MGGHRDLQADFFGRNVICICATVIYVEQHFRQSGMAFRNATPDALTKLLIRATVGTRAKTVKQIMQRRENGEKTQHLLRVILEAQRG
jgi:hypothetical protein